MGRAATRGRGMGAWERQSQTEAEESATPRCTSHIMPPTHLFGSWTRALTNPNQRTRSSARRRGGLPVRWLGSARPGSRLTSSRRAALAHKGSSSSCCVVRAVQPLRAKTALLLHLLLLLLPRFFGMFFLSFCVSSAHTRTRRGATSRVGW